MYDTNFSHRLRNLRRFSSAKRRKACLAICLAVCLGLSACGNSWNANSASGTGNGTNPNESSLDATGSNGGKQDGDESGSTGQQTTGTTDGTQVSQPMTPDQYVAISDRISPWMAIMPDGVIFFNERSDIEQWAPKLLAINAEDNPITKLRAMIYLQTKDKIRESIAGVLAIRQDGSAFLDGEPILQDTPLNDACYFANNNYIKELYEEGWRYLILAAPKEGELFLYNPENGQRHPLGISNVTRITKCITLTSAGSFVLQHDDLTYEMYCVNPDEDLQQLDVSCLNGAVNICAMSDFAKLYETPSLAENAMDIQRETFILAGLKSDGTVVGNANVPEDVRSWEDLFHLTYVYRSMSSPGYEKDIYENTGFIGLRENQPMLMKGHFPYYEGLSDDKGNFAVRETENVMVAQALGSAFNNNFCFYTGYRASNEYSSPREMWRGVYSDGHLFTYMITPDGTAYKYNRNNYYWSQDDKWLNP